VRDEVPDRLEAELTAAETAEQHRARFPHATIEVKEAADLTVAGGRLLRFALDYVVETAIVHSDRDHPSVSRSGVLRCWPAVPDRPG